MGSALATVVYVIGIAVLFILDRDRTLRTSVALWIPVVWLLLAGSRPLSLWLNAGSVVNSTDMVNVEANPLNVLVFSALMAVGVIVLVSRRNKVGILLQTNWPILLFFSYCAISTVWSDYPSAALRKWIRSSGDLMMVVIILTELDPVAALRRLLTRPGFVLLPLSVLLIKYYPELGRAYSNGYELMYKGVTDHKNTLGMICMIFGLGFIWLCLEHLRAKRGTHRGRHLIACGAILATIVWLLWMANSMTSTSCFLMATALIAVTSLSSSGQRPWVVHLLVAGLVGFSLFALFADPDGNLIESLGRNPTLTGRTAIWQQVIGMAGNPLFGTGFESFWLGDRLRDFWGNNVGSTINEAHNGYLEVYLNLGWCGVTLLMLLIVTGYRNVLVAYRRDRDYGGLKLAYFVAAVIYSLTEAGFRMISPTWIFFLLATTAVPQPSSGNVLNLYEEVPLPEHWVAEHEGSV